MYICHQITSYERVTSAILKLFGKKSVYTISKSSFGTAIRSSHYKQEGDKLINIFLLTLDLTKIQRKLHI